MSNSELSTPANSDAPFKVLFESVPGLFLVLLPDFTIYAVSDDFSKAIMKKREDMIQRFLFDVFPGNPDTPTADVAANLLLSLNNVLHHKTLHTLSFIQKYSSDTPDEVLEERYWNLINKPVLNSRNEIIYIIHRAEDITNFIHRQNAELAAAKELQSGGEKSNDILSNSLNELKSRFVSMASHEFRTPLSTILSSASLIESYNQQDQVEKRNKHTDRIKASVKNLTDILDDFLSLENLEMGKVTVHEEPFNIPALSQDIIQEVTGRLKPRQIIHYSHSGEQETTGDKKIFRDILYNLLSNAIKYSSEKKPVSLMTALDNNAVTLIVKDEGIGIPQTEQPYIFEKFYRAKNVTNIQGTGLGLNIVKKLVELSGGMINFTSKINDGTTFTISLPAKVTGAKNRL